MENDKNTNPTDGMDNKNDVPLNEMNETIN